MDNSFLNGFETEVLLLLDGSYGVWVQILSWFHLLVFQPVMIVIFGMALIKAGVFGMIRRVFMFTVRIISLPLVAVFWVVWNIISNLEHIKIDKNNSKNNKII
tara:strand:- start:44 stop:352 length:309 start_codon:yes stop_codon:yes gene_type:complete